jgi:hypothetical protein
MFLCQVKRCQKSRRDQSIEKKVADSIWDDSNQMVTRRTNAPGGTYPPFTEGLHSISFSPIKKLTLDLPQE